MPASFSLRSQDAAADSQAPADVSIATYTHTTFLTAINPGEKFIIQSLLSSLWC